MAASGGAWTPPILRGAHEPTGAVDLSLPSRAALASRAVATKPEWPRALGSYAAPHQPLVASAYCLSSLSPAPHGRYYLRQEPDAVVPLVRICGGGREQSRSLLRLACYSKKLSACIRSPRSRSGGRTLNAPIRISLR